METKTSIRKPPPPVLDKRLVLLGHLQAILQTTYMQETAAALYEEVEKKEVDELEGMLNEPSSLERFACHTLQKWYRYVVTPG